MSHPWQASRHGVPTPVEYLVAPAEDGVEADRGMEPPRKYAAHPRDVQEARNLQPVLRRVDVEGERERASRQLAELDRLLQPTLRISAPPDPERGAWPALTPHLQLQ